MSKSEKQQETYNKLIIDYVDSKNQVGLYLLKMAQIIAEAKQQLNRKYFKKFLREPKINLKRLQANKMIAVYELSKSDSRLTPFINKEGIEKSYQLTTIKDTEHRLDFAEKVIDIPFSVKETRLAVNKINNENKTPEIAIDEVKNKIGLPQRKNQRKTIPVEEYEKLKKENLLLKQKIAELEKNQAEKPDLNVEEIDNQKSFDYSYLN